MALGQTEGPQPSNTPEPVGEPDQPEVPDERADARRAVLLEPGGAGASDRDPDQVLVNANFQQFTDSQGFRWDVQSSYGGINDGSNDCFDGGLFLYVNNAQFGARNKQMTSDGQEYVFSNTMGALQVTRRVLINRELASARFLEVFQNLTDQKQQVTVQIRTNLGSTPQSTLGSDGKPFAGSMAKDQIGIYSVSRGSNRPSVAYLLTDSRDKKYRPDININSDNVYTTWQLEVPPKDTVVILHGVAQRSGGNPLPTFEALYSRGFVHAQVPKELQKKIVNFKMSRQLNGTPLVDRATRLAEEFDLERGDDDLLWIDDETTIAGRVKAEQLTMTTEFGTTTVPWGDVAAVVGGAGVDARMQLLLRNGEVFHGVLSAKGMTLSSPDGIDAQIDLSKLEFLLARASPGDNTVSAEARLMLTTGSGQRLLIDDAGPAVLSAATPWGKLDVPVDQIAFLAPDEGSDFSQRVLLRDGTRLVLIPRPSPLTVKTRRFGPVSVAASRVQSLCRLIQLKEDADESELDASPLAPETPGGPFATLVGENMLPGRLSFDSLTLHHEKGQEQIQAGEVKRLELVLADAVRPRFKVDLRTGKTLEGRLDVTQFRLQGGLREWIIPAAHLQAYDAGDLLPEPKPEPGVQPDTEPVSVDTQRTLHAAEAS